MSNDGTKKQKGASSAAPKNRHAVILGRKGGRKGGLARAKNLTAKERSEGARKAVQARWEKYRLAKKTAEKKSKTKGTKAPK